jgi:hypothetical protein
MQSKAKSTDFMLRIPADCEPEGKPGAQMNVSGIVTPEELR